MKHPIWIALAAGLAVLLVAFAMPLWHWLGDGSSPRDVAAVAPVSGSTAAADAPAQNSGLPWQIVVTGDGRSEVFGLQLGRDQLAQVIQRFGDDLQVALVARLDEVGLLEVFLEPMRAGFVSGRLVAGFDVPADVLSRWRANSPKSQVMAGGVRRFALLPADLAEAAAMPLVSLSFVPGVRLSQDDVLERFGPPEASHALPEQALAMLYPAKGLLVLVQPGLRGVLQYVAPAQFEARLRAPLTTKLKTAPG